MKSMDAFALTRYPARYDMQYDEMILRMARPRGHNVRKDPSGAEAEQGDRDRQECEMVVKDH